jgi:hypothetical protein
MKTLSALIAMLFTSASLSVLAQAPAAPAKTPADVTKAGDSPKAAPATPTVETKKPAKKKNPNKKPADLTKSGDSPAAGPATPKAPSDPAKTNPAKKPADLTKSGGS